MSWWLRRRSGSVLLGVIARRDDPAVPGNVPSSTGGRYSATAEAPDAGWDRGGEFAALRRAQAPTSNVAPVGLVPETGRTHRVRGIRLE